MLTPRKADTEALVDDAIARNGAVDILVNNAGGSSRFALIAEVSDGAWSEAGDWLLSSAFWATRRALPSVVSAGSGRVVKISSLESPRQCRRRWPRTTPRSCVPSTGHPLRGGGSRDGGHTADAICPGPSARIS